MKRSESWKTVQQSVFRGSNTSTYSEMAFMPKSYHHHKVIIKRSVVRAPVLGATEYVDLAAMQHGLVLLPK